MRLLRWQRWAPPAAPDPRAVLSLQALGVAVSAAVRGSDKLAFAVAPGITVILMLFGKWSLWPERFCTPGVLRLIGQ